jgi:hypothetical protein
MGDTYKGAGVRGVNDEGSDPVGVDTGGEQHRPH